MAAPLYHVDAFTFGPFTGNPAAVCLLDEPGDPGWMQLVAAEMNLSETAFVRPLDGGEHWSLRWFTPTVEVELCGHATLASAHVLWETGRLPLDSVARFDTRSGVLESKRRDDLVELALPSDPLTTCEAGDELLSALGTASARSAARGRTGWLVEVADEGAVRALRPDFPRLAALGSAVVTAPSDDPSFDFVSRYFAPGYGIDEDPVTGSAHCALAPYWGQRLGKEEMTAYQASKRGGVVRVRIAGDQVLVAGRAITVSRGELV